MINRARLNAIAVRRSTEPRRHLPVNEVVAAASNPNLFAQQAQKGVNAQSSNMYPTSAMVNNHMPHSVVSTFRDSGYQSSTGNLSAMGFGNNMLQTGGPLLPGQKPSGSTQ